MHVSKRETEHDKIPRKVKERKGKDRSIVNKHMIELKGQKQEHSQDV